MTDKKETEHLGMDRERLWKVISETEREIVELERSLQELTGPSDSKVHADERRAQRRWQCDHTIHICLADGTRSPGQLCDISLGGLRICTKASVKPSDSILVILDDDVQSEVVLGCEVRWVALEKEDCIAGARFDDLTLDARTFISKLINQVTQVTQVTPNAMSPEVSRNPVEPVLDNGWQRAEPQGE